MSPQACLYVQDIGLQFGADLIVPINSVVPRKGHRKFYFALPMSPNYEFLAAVRPFVMRLTILYLVSVYMHLL